jgi:hypothetical protein
MIIETIKLNLMDSKRVRDVLSIFYEGFFEELAVNGKDINFKIECAYLAEKQLPGSRYFYGTLKDVKEFYFCPWEEGTDEIHDVAAIESLKLDILGAEYLYDKVKIYSNCCHSYSGGNLYINAFEVKIYDETFERVDLNDLYVKAEEYWDTINNY